MNVYCPRCGGPTNTAGQCQRFGCYDLEPTITVSFAYQQWLPLKNLPPTPNGATYIVAYHHVEANRYHFCLLKYDTAAIRNERGYYCVSLNNNGTVPVI